MKRVFNGKVYVEVPMAVVDTKGTDLSCEGCCFRCELKLCECAPCTPYERDDNQFVIYQPCEAK